ncbi:MAG TPA: hypothetical protein VK518_01105 [Puia sp.]|nr:hypothetical protein [Puia sp.]
MSLQTRLKKPQFIFNLFFFGLLFCSTVLSIWKYNAVLDDAYMFIRYANNMIKGGTYGWNFHEKTFGCTSIPYTFFIVLMKITGIGRILNPKQILLAASCFWAIAAMLLFHKTLKMITRGSQLSNNIFLKGIILLIVLTPTFVTNMGYGMDTTLSLFANTLVLYLLLSFLEAPSFRKLAVAVGSCYFTFLVRPDNIIYAGTLPFLFLFFNKRPRKEFFLTYSILGGLLLLDTLIKYFYFGNPLPLPFYAKSSGFYEGYVGIFKWNPMEYLLIFLLSFGSLLLLLNILAFTRKTLRASAPYLIPFILTMGYYFTVTQIMGMSGRYYLPSIPFLVGGLIAALSASLSEKTNFIAPVKITSVVVMVTAFLFSYTFITPIYNSWKMSKAVAIAKAFTKDTPDKTYEAPVESWGGALNTISNTLTHLPKDIRIAASEYGYISAYNPDLPILDLCGLQDKYIAMRGWNDSVLRAFNPDLIWMIHKDYTALYYKISHGAYFMEAYDFYPNVLAYGIAVRKNSSYYALIKNELIIEARHENQVIQFAHLPAQLQDHY